MDYPFWKNANFATFSNRCFYRVKSLFLYAERQQTVLFGIFSLKRKSEKNYSFGKKPWTNPFKRMQILRPFQIDVL